MKRGKGNLLSVLVVLAMIFWVPSMATADLILDQQNVIATSGSDWEADQVRHLSGPPYVPKDTYDQYAQTFTVGIAGTLSRVDVEVYHVFATYGPVLVELWNTSSGIPDPSVSLAGWGINDGNSSMTLGSFVSLDMGAAAFAVTPGQVYAITFSPQLSYSLWTGGRYWVRGTSDSYLGGNSFYRIIDSDNNGGNFQTTTGDYGFRTYVNVVPEPTAMLLLGLGLVGLAGVRRKIQKKLAS